MAKLSESEKYKVAEKYVEFLNKRTFVLKGFDNPFRFGYFNLWLSYNMPEMMPHNCELHDFICKVMVKENDCRDYDGQGATVNGEGCDPWID